MMLCNMKDFQKIKVTAGNTLVMLKLTKHQIKMMVCLVLRLKISK